MLPISNDLIQPPHIILKQTVKIVKVSLRMGAVWVVSLMLTPMKYKLCLIVNVINQRRIAGLIKDF